MLRSSADDMERNPGVAQRFSPQLLRRLANRIGTDMVELPRDRDGKPIHIGDTVYVDCNLFGFKVNCIEYHDNLVSIGLAANGVHAQKEPSILTHECPDSWECISQELEDMSENFRMTDKESFSALIDFADRIRKLAEKDDRQ